ncbi:hypothetical protein XENTR_v10010284 [Xenopus tropicalis]|uniref:Olfactory receptor 5V1-like n=1 Tax=Xenopus tropicalis TaxID=8364 RepID=A0A8J0QTJ8_XENTR|nr:olfactory receptor 5V1-like [Xenopus tropicalis]KAE8620504.1 hypothetical protein XENTR_v10010284 [Xenopus tropicalis]|eukprot:XP_002941996.1 PREDICTED: olfactory receptor 5V1-like [Xenopus tropicalis]
MQEWNQTIITELFLVGFGDLHRSKYFFFCMFFLLYLVALKGNLLVITLVIINEALHLPMYFFLSQLSLSEIIFTSNMVPTILRLILSGGGNMSVSGCKIQFFALCVPTLTQCLLLAAMSFDRYVAICNPLHYTSIMTFKLQLWVAIFCWVCGFSACVLVIVFIYQLQFCRSNVINHFACDIGPVMEISCSDTSRMELVTSLVSTVSIAFPFLFIIGSYISIILTILRIPSSFGRQKAFSTCSSHLAVVCMYYGTLVALYIYPFGKHSANAKFIFILYTSVTPLFNPIIYSLRNQDIKRAIRKLVSICKKKIDV